MIDALLSSPTTRMLEQTLSFTEQRHAVLLEDLANFSTPGHVQKDVSVSDFQAALRKAAATADAGGEYEPESNENVAFEPDGSAVEARAVENSDGTAFHDRSVRNLEGLESDLADNALAHNMTAQFLKSRYDLLSRAISMKA